MASTRACKTYAHTHKTSEKYVIFTALISHSVEEGERISFVYGAGGIDLRQALERGLGYAVMHHFFKFNYTIANLPNLKIGPVWIQHAHSGF